MQGIHHHWATIQRSRPPLEDSISSKLSREASRINLEKRNSNMLLAAVGRNPIAAGPGLGAKRDAFRRWRLVRPIGQIMPQPFPEHMQGNLEWPSDCHNELNFWLRSKDLIPDATR